MQNSEQVFVNGTFMREVSDYNIINSHIVFETSPDHQAEIIVSTKLHGGGTYIVMHTGDGVQKRFAVDDAFKQAQRFRQLFDDTEKFIDHPTVANLLDQLQSVITLIKDEARQS
jgi:hypothetical protein